MSIYSKALQHVDSKDFRKTHQRRLDEQKVLRRIEREQQLQERKEVEEIKKLATPLKYDWRSDIFPQEEEPKQIEVVEEIKVKVPEKLKSNWREEFYSVEPEVGQIIEEEEEEDVVEVPDELKSNWRKEINEGMTTKDFEYLYGLSIHTLQINSVLGNVENINAQEIVKSSAQTTDYQFGVNFPGSYINSIGDNQIVSQSKVDALAYLDTTYGNVSGDHTSFRLTTGPEGIPPEGQSPPGSVISRVNLETALGVTLPAGVPNGNLGGTPIEGSAIKRVFTDATPGKRINFNWSFASSEDALGPITVDDYAFVAIKGQVTKLVSVLTKGLIYNGQFIYTVKPEDIVNGQVEIGIGVMDVYDPYVQTTFNISNFGTFWDAGTLGSTTDAADLGMSVAAATPQSQQKKQKDDELSKAVAADATPTLPVTPLQKFINHPLLRGKGPASSVGFLEGMDSAERNEVLKALGPTATSTFNQIQQYKELNQKLSQSGNTAGWDRAVQVSELIQQLYDKFGKEMSEMVTYEKELAAYEKALAADKQKSDELSKAVAAARAEYLKPGLTYAQIMASYAKLQAAIKASTDHALSTLRNPITKPTPPSSQTSPTPPTPEKLANIEASLKQLEIDKQKDRDEANRRNWELAANIGMDALTAAALLSPIPGDEAVAIGARTASQTRAFARNFQRQNPGKYNPFLPDKANALARKQGVGTNVGGQNPAFRQPIKNSYESQADVIMERKTLKTVQQALYPGQPSPNGFPDAPPPEMVNGYHPDYGKKSNMYNTLDKESAMSMPLTGDPEIDAKILKARKQPK